MDTLLPDRNEGKEASSPLMRAESTNVRKCTAQGSQWKQKDERRSGGTIACEQK